MTAGVVLATLTINATTIGALGRSLGLDRPGPLERWVAAAARFDGARTARQELGELVSGTEVDTQLEEVENAAATEIAGLELDEEEVHQALLRRGLSVERTSLQDLIDQGLLPQWHGRVALNSLEDQLDELALGRASERGLFEAHGFGRLVYEIARRIHLGRVTPEKWVDLAYRDLNARLKAAADAIAALEHFSQCPGLPPGAIERARKEFQAWHERSRGNLAMLERSAPAELITAARRRYASDLGRLASHRELHELTELGLVSKMAEEHAAELIASHLLQCERDRLHVEIAPEEDVGV